MSSLSALPPSLQTKLLVLARRIRLLRALRGSSLVLLILLLTGAAALLVDAWLELPAGVRGFLLAGWLGLGAWITLFRLVLPLCWRLRPEAVAALIEEKYPDLGERLTSTVELAEDARTYHGSPALIGLLMNETAVRSQCLDFREALPVRASGWFAIGTVLAVLLAVLPAWFAPTRYAELGQRFFLPWQAPQPAVSYTLAVAPGDAVAVKGQPLTLSVRIGANTETVVWPTASTLVLTAADGQTSRRRMRADRPDAFSLKLESISGDFHYHIEAGSAVSDTYQITAVTPVHLAAESPTITITPPEYARAARETQTVHGLTDLSALQHSRIRFDFHFTHPAVTAQWKWSPRSGAKDQDRPATTDTLTLTPNRLGASCELPALGDGQFQLVLEGKHGIRTELEPQLLTVQVDQPPVFVKVPLSDRLHEARQAVLPHDSIPLEILLADDLTVARAEIEYRRHEDPVRVEPIPLQGNGTPQASAKFWFELGDMLLREGDVVHYRLKALDNRRVPAAGLGPNITYYPVDRWLTLKISDQAEPLRQQEITAEHDALQQRLEAIKADLLKEQRGLYKLRQEARTQSPLKAEQARALKQLRQDHRTSTSALRDIAGESAATPGLQPLAQLAQEVADGEMHRGGAALQAAEKEEQAEPRERRFESADQELSAALDRLEGLRRVNDLVAQKRIDQLQLQRLAERQQALADRAEGLPEAAEKTAIEPLQRAQGDLAQELQRLGDQSDWLRDALKADRAEQARQLANRAQELAQAQRELAKTTPANQQRPQGERLAELTRQQRALAEQADRLAKETRPATQVAQVNALQPENARKAAEALKQGDAGEALQHQEQSARELERLATDLERATEQARDPRQQAQQLARLQESLRQQLKEAVKQSDAKVPLAQQLQDVQQEQESLRQALKQLPVPEQKPDLQKEHREATERANQAVRALHKPNAAEADARMKDTRQALERLASQLAERPSSTPSPAQAEESPRSPRGMPNQQQADQARQLARQQRDVQDAVQRLTEESPAPEKEGQRDLQRQAEDLQRQLNRLAEQMAPTPPAQQALQQATRSTEQAQSAMRQAQEQDRQSNPGRSQQARARAAQALDQAAQQAEQAAPSQAARQGQQTGQALRQAQTEMSQAQSQLTQGQNQGAQTAMQRAAEALQQALQQLAPSQGQAGQPGSAAQATSGGVPEGGTPDPTPWSAERKQYAGKPWGELPGELRTQVLQNMKARYGEDYARIIKLYFEQIADTKK